MSDLSPLESARRVSACSQLCHKQVLEALASINVEADLCAIQKSPDIHQKGNIMVLSLGLHGSPSLSKQACL